MLHEQMQGGAGITGFNPWPHAGKTVESFIPALFLGNAGSGVPTAVGPGTSAWNGWGR